MPSQNSNSNSNSNSNNNHGNRNRNQRNNQGNNHRRRHWSGHPRRNKGSKAPNVTFVDSPTKLGAMLDDLKSYQQIALDLEGVDLGREHAKARMVFITLQGQHAKPVTAPTQTTTMTATATTGPSGAGGTAGATTTAATTSPAVASSTTSTDAGPPVQELVAEASTTSPVYLVDMDGIGFAAAGMHTVKSVVHHIHNGVSLKTILEDASVWKLFWDSRNDAYCLWKEADTVVNSADDLQVYNECLVDQQHKRSKAGWKLLGLRQGIKFHLGRAADTAPEIDWDAPEHPCEFPRPITGKEPIVRYAALDVSLFFQIFRRIVSKPCWTPQTLALARHISNSDERLRLRDRKSFAGARWTGTFGRKLPSTSRFYA